ncbi:MAG TPA: isoprenylcysteine carboxylmethyltransferase family protein [Caldilineaceae bacterium]|nr:isoprenylcysteine carboxylmethyltransferase family protein [Caldilineaceae bacterium]
MSVDSAHKSHWAIAEVVFGIPFLISIALQFIAPFSLPSGMLRQVLIPLGSVLILSGLGVILLARREFAAHGQPTDPGHPTSEVIKTGVFAISRNPLYLGSVLLLLGVGLAFNLLWTVGMLLLSMILCQYILIMPEERYLAAKFGDEYRTYMASVRRWLGRK